MEKKLMDHKNSDIVKQLQVLDLGSSVAEEDNLLETARVETSAFTDLFNDKVDLVPGTKGSGKSALFRIFVVFLPDTLLSQRKVVVAHGIESPGDPVFHAFRDQFEKLDEQDFVSFWCIYLVSLAHEQFIKGERYGHLLEVVSREIDVFRRACQSAKIPEIKAKKPLREILDWALYVLESWKPKVTYKSPDGHGDIEVDLFGTRHPQPAKAQDEDQSNSLPKYVNDIKESLEKILEKAQLSLWLMIDRLDEIFPRRSDLEKTALRGLLRDEVLFVKDHSCQNLPSRRYARSGRAFGKRFHGPDAYYRPPCRHTTLDRGPDPVHGGEENIRE